MTNQQLQSKKYIIDYLSEEERNDTPDCAELHSVPTL